MAVNFIDGGTGVPCVNHRPTARHWQSLPHKVASGIPSLSGIRNNNVSTNWILIIQMYHNIPHSLWNSIAQPGRGYLWRRLEWSLSLLFCNKIWQLFWSYCHCMINTISVYIHCRWNENSFALAVENARKSCQSLTFLPVSETPTYNFWSSTHSIWTFKLHNACCIRSLTNNSSSGIWIMKSEW